MEEKKYLHKGLVASGRWLLFSFDEQMGNIGSEVGRAANWQNKNKEIFKGAVARGLELFDLTLDDKRWSVERIAEIKSLRKSFCDLAFDGKEDKGSLHDLADYFMPFAYAARRNVGV